MDWSEDKMFKILLTRSHKTRDDLSVQFKVKKDQKDSFRALLNNYLDFCVANNAKITVDTVDESDTHLPYFAVISIKGIQELYVQELQRRIEQFRPTCTEIL
jgi:hypothetical protein